MLPRVILRPKRAAPFFGRHPWVYPGAIDHVEGEPADGAVVDLVEEGRGIGDGIGPGRGFGQVGKETLLVLGGATVPCCQAGAKPQGTDLLARRRFVTDRLDLPQAFRPLPARF